MVARSKPRQQERSWGVQVLENSFEHACCVQPCLLTGMSCLGLRALGPLRCMASSSYCFDHQSHNIQRHNRSLNYILYSRLKTVLDFHCLPCSFSQVVDELNNRGDSATAWPAPDHMQRYVADMLVRHLETRATSLGRLSWHSTTRGALAHCW